MIEEQYINELIDIYGAAFDSYWEYGILPDTFPEDDAFLLYIKSVINDNPQPDNQNELWKEILKDDLMAFLSVLLQICMPIEEQYLLNLNMCDRFQQETIEGKRNMWSLIYRHIKQNFDKREIDIDNLITLFNEENTEIVLDVLIEAWKNANERQRMIKKELILQQYKRKFEHYVRESAPNDFKEKRKIEVVYYQYPILKEIVQILGREQYSKKKEELDDIIMKFVPVLPNYPQTTMEREEIYTGNNLNHIIPLEVTYLTEKDMEMIFCYKYATCQLQQFTSSLCFLKSSKNKKNLVKPRLEAGPIIVSIDTSASMHGVSEIIAKSLLIQLLRMAKRKKRKCYLITFSVRSASIELTSPHNWKLLNKFLNDKFTGGTNGESMLYTVLETLKKDDFVMADVLIISDFCFPLPLNTTIKDMKIEHDKGTRFYGLLIDKHSCSYENILDKTWKIQKQQ